MSPRLSEDERTGLTTFVTAAVQLELQHRALTEIEDLRARTEQAETSLRFFEERLESDDGERLRELMHAYSMIAELTRNLGGKVSIPQDKVYNKTDTQLQIYHPSDGDDAGKIVLKLKN